MRTILLLGLFFGSTFFIPLRAQLNETFLDGDFTSNPRWTGDVSEYVINNSRLQSNGPGSSGVLSLSTPNTRVADTEWQFFLDLAFNPSASNRVRVYLVADRADLEDESLQGYYVEIGESSGDQIRFFRQDGASRTELFAGQSDITGNLGNLRVQVTRDNLGNWNVAADLAGGTNFVSEGSFFTDNTYTQTSHFGLVTFHTSTRNDAFFYDDLIIQENLQPTRLIGAQVLGPQELLLTFSRELNEASAQNVGNYSFSPDLGTPTQATPSASSPNQVTLQLANPLERGISYTLTLNNLLDINGNALDAASLMTSVQFTQRSVVIHEILADPSPVVALPEAEFVELFNPSAQAIQLAGWSLAGASLDSFNLAAGSYLILCAQADTASFQSFGDVLGLSSWNTLTNSGEELTLLDAEGNSVDRVFYQLAWYQDDQKDDGGFSLEQINPDFPCTSADNWRASQDISGGTPGRLNSIDSDALDTRPPTIAQLSLSDATSLLITFNETMESASLLNPANYQISPDLSVVSAQSNAPENTQVSLGLNAPSQIGQIYQITLNNIRDCSSNTLLDNQASFGLGNSPGYLDLTINEIFADPEGNAAPLIGLPTFEFLEIYNRSDRVLDLQNITLQDGTGDVTLPQAIISPQSYLVLCDAEAVSAYSTLSSSPVIGLADFPSLSNGGETLSLLNAQNQLIFSVTYSDSWYQNSSKADGAWTLEMIDPENPCGDRENWIASVDENGGTPGAINSVDANNPDMTAPSLVRAEAISAQVLRLSFNEKMDEASLLNGTYTLDQGITVDSVRPEFPDFTQVFLDLSPALSPQVSYTIQVDNQGDCSGNLISSEANTRIFGLAEPADSGNILLSELLFNPRTGGSDFVELYNDSDKFVNLNQWELANLDDGILANRVILSEEDFIMAPQSYLVLTPNPDNILNEYSLSAGQAFLEVSLPSLPDDEGTLFLINSQAEIQERFDYTDDFHYALLDDREGVSLERISYDLPTNSPNSWQSASTRSGFATPGSPNSQEIRLASGESKVEILPKVFTPNGDGIDDFTTIQLSFESSGFQVQEIIIFDKFGRRIRRLVQNQLLGNDRVSYIWDGSDDQGDQVRMGYYVAYIEVLGLNGQNEVFKESLVVGKQF